MTGRGAFRVFGVELAKLTAQPRAWGVLGVCALSPFLFVLALQLQSSVPEDTLFGRGVKASGFAVPLFLLEFSSAWAFPILASVVGGDVFSADDGYGTWPSLLTRSRTRGELFAGKVLAAFTFSSVAVLTLALAGVAAGLLSVGRQPLLGLSGALLPPGQALPLVAAAWASVLPPVLAFTALAVLLSVATRSSVAGVGGPVLLGLAMELLSLVNGPEALRRAMLTPPLVAWHGLFVEHRYYGPLLQGTAVSVVYLVLSLVASRWILLRRDVRS